MTSNHANQSRNRLLACCGAHIIQDGLVALQFVLLPLLAQSLGLNYAQVGLLRALSNLAMSLLEIPSGILAERYGERRLLIFGLIAAAAGYLGVAVSTSFGLIALFFVLTGAGAGFQHSLASAVLVKTFGPAQKRRALGTYNASGDAGKLSFTGLFSLGIGAGFAWNSIVTVLSLVALAFAFALWKLLPDEKPESKQRAQTDRQTSLVQRCGIKKPRQFTLLAIVVTLDSAVQTVFLTFLAFVLINKGASTEVASFGVVLALCGGMTGKFCCGFLTARFGDHLPFVFIQLLTIAGLAAVILMPLITVLITLPLIGLTVQGSSTVTYGAISDHIETSHQSRGFALIYSFSGIATVIGPFAFGQLADFGSLDLVLWALCAITALSIPLASFLKDQHQLVDVDSR
ncbi:MAG: FSR family fosmidomycin resistance protein-like MFS transporter [Gammaproteobacteria bacterium]|jgi:FSR family fosmidomycin resistance protein-like MFS transporter